MLLNHYVLFTGGLDSTYRLAQLIQDKSAVIQPVYIEFPSDGLSSHVRPDLSLEIRAQDRILKYLSTHPLCFATLLPIRRIYRDDIPKRLDIMRLEPYLVSFGLGWQYLYFHLLSQWYPLIEMCHEDYMEPRLKNHLFFRHVGPFCLVDTDKSDSVLATLFSSFLFPIFGVSRPAMIADIESWNMSPLLDMIHFCYKSVDGMPCGICDNCRGKIEQGLKRLFPRQSIHRYLLYRYVKDFLSQAFYEVFTNFYVYHKDDIAFLHNCPYYVKYRFADLNKIDSLSDDSLKNIIIHGSLNYPFSSGKKSKILRFSHDKSRLSMFDFLA